MMDFIILSITVLLPYLIQNSYCSEILKDLEDSGSETAEEVKHSEHEMDVFEGHVLDAMRLMSIRKPSMPSPESSHIASPVKKKNDGRQKRAL